MTIFGLFACNGCSEKKQTNMGEEIDIKSSHYSMSDFTHVQKIDVHAHISSENPAMLEEASANNFKLMVMAVDVPDYPSIQDQLDILINHYKKYKNIFSFSTTFSLDGWDESNWAVEVIEQLGRDFDNGAVGVKVWKNIGMVDKDNNDDLIMLYHDKFDAIFQFIKDQNKVLICHAGEPKNCWLPLHKMTVNSDINYFEQHPEYHMYLHPELPSYEDQMEARNRMLEKNRELSFVGAHLASLEWSIDEISHFLDHFPFASVDLAERICHLQVQSEKDYQKVRDFIIKYQDRILYGTDFGQSKETDITELRKRMHRVWSADWKYFNTDDTMTVPQLNVPFKGLKLPKTVADKIYRLNAEKVFKDAW